MIFIEKHKTENVLNANGLVLVFDNVVIHDELYLQFSYKGIQLALMFGDQMNEALERMHELDIKVVVDNIGDKEL
jgi:hypothetical protein